jgi:hypothetical protein
MIARYGRKIKKCGVIQDLPAKKLEALLLTLPKTPPETDNLVLQKHWSLIF